MNDKSISSILTEKRVFPPPEEFAARATLKPADVEALYAEAEADHETVRSSRSPTWEPICRSPQITRRTIT